MSHGHYYYTILQASIPPVETGMIVRPTYLVTGDDDFYIGHPMSADVPALICGIDANSRAEMTRKIMEMMKEYLAITVWHADIVSLKFRILVLSSKPGYVDVWEIKPDNGVGITKVPLNPTKLTYNSVYYLMRKMEGVRI